MLKKYAKFADNKSFLSIVHAQKHTNTISFALSPPQKVARGDKNKSI